MLNVTVIFETKVMDYSFTTIYEYLEAIKEWERMGYKVLK